jgi:hypothetical protein
LFLQFSEKDYFPSIFLWVGFLIRQISFSADFSCFYILLSRNFQLVNMLPSKVDACGMYSWTPLLMAVRGNYPAIVSLLLQYSPNVNAVDQEGMTALAIACKEGSTDIAFQLLAAGAYVNLQVGRDQVFNKSKI